MALSRRTGQRFQAAIWPGFVDAMTGLLLVLMFVLTIFMVVQFVLRETISGQEDRLDQLSAEVAALAQALGLEQDRTAGLTERVGVLTATLGDAQAREEVQAQAFAAAQAEIASFEEQVASLLAEREGNLASIAGLEGERDTLLSEQEQLQLALANLRDEIDEQAEAARLAAAQREALEALAADLRRENADVQATLSAQVEDMQAQLSEEEAARLAQAAAAEALRKRFENAQAELTAMTLALEEERRRAEETLTLLAATEATRDDLNARLAEALLSTETRQEELTALRDELARVTTGLQELGMSPEDVREALTAALAAKLAAEQEAEKRFSEAEERAALLAAAREELAAQEGLTEDAQREQTLLNQQIAALRQQLGALQALLDDSAAREAAANVQLQSLGADLNAALARVAAEEKKRREAEEEKNALLQAENQTLEQYRSDFFGQLRDILGAQEGVRIDGDRFVFSSEVLFAPGKANLSHEGQGEIAKVAAIISNVIDDIPPEIDWVIRVDGHTDDVPIRNSPDFADNWELSQARALSVVRYMINVLGLPPDRLSANGFGQYQPINPAKTPEARAQNRRIELKFTEK